MTPKLHLSIPLLLCVLGASVVQTHAQAPGGVFQKFDKNADGKVTTEELPNAQAFDRFDTNKDGSITLEEYNAVTGGTTPKPATPPATPTTPAKPGETPAPPAAPAANPTVASVLKAFDKNADGKITKDDAGDAAWFTQADQNGDGVLDETEMQRVSGFAQKMSGGSQFAGMVTQYDKDGNGSITREEAAGAKWFDRLDQNADGVVDAAELERLRQFMQQAGGGTPGTSPTTPSSPTMPPKTAETPTVPADAVFSGYDKNSDSKVTKDELANEAAFQRYDLDKDGAISLAEYNKVSGKTAPTPPGTPTTPPGSPPPATGAGGGMAAQIENMIKAVDKNADGQITKDEAGDAPWFTRLDQDANGIISAEELAMMRRIVAQRGGGAGTGTGGRGMPTNAPTITPEDVQKITSGPEVLKPGEVGIGRMIEDISFTSLDGQNRRLGDMQGKKGLVVIMTSATCPVSKRYIPSVAKLEKELAAQNVALLLVNPFASETADEIKAQLTEAGVTAPYVHDTEKKLAITLQARTTTEVFLLDAARTLVYRGAFDDQYGINYNLEAPKHRYLHDAITAFLKNEKPTIQATAALFDKLDADKDGFVSEAELTALWKR
jgi:Ca2+-binding EF-hand superfamily protein